jgi:hypothetical protein
MFLIHEVDNTKSVIYLPFLKGYSSYGGKSGWI